MAFLWLTVTHFLCFLDILFSAELSTELEETYSRYYSNVELGERLQALARRYSDISSVLTAGRSVEGRELWVMRITHPLTEIPGKPRVQLGGNLHGDEALARQLLLYLAEYLLSRHGADSRVSSIINSTEVYLWPSMNPDGFERALQGECEGNQAARETARQVDLNRAFPPHNDPSASETTPELSAIIQWILHKKFVLSGNLQGGSVWTRYPFDDFSFPTLTGVYNRTPDDALFRYLAQTYSENHPIMQQGKPQCLDESNIQLNDSRTNEDQGTMQSFSYFHGNCFEVTFELSCCKYPMASDLLTEWNNNREALLTFIEKVHIGVKGYVMTSTGIGIPDSIISIAGINHNVTTWKFGDYFRLLLPGSYNITASSPGYLPVTVNDVTVTEGRPTLLNFILKDLSEELPVAEPSVPLAYTSTNLVHPSPSVQPQVFSYHSYMDMVLFLKQIRAIYSPITLLYSIGQSALGRELYVMEISVNPGLEQPGKPEVMFLGNRYGGDAAATEILLRLLEYLCSNYGQEPTVTTILNNTRVHILPSMNPDDYETADTGLKPEVTKVMDWIKAQSFILSASVYGGMTGLSNPNSADPPDKALFELIKQAYITEFPSLPNCEGPDLNKKDDWRVISAFDRFDLQDWTYHNTDTLAVSIGLGCDPHPSPEKLTTYWQQNQRALIHFIQQVQLSVRGKVTDSQSGQAVPEAAITVEGSRHIVHSSRTGLYWRPLAPGNYQLNVVAPGYTAVTASVTMAETWMPQVDFDLTAAQKPDPDGQKQEDEFCRLVEELSSPQALDQALKDDLPARTLHYRRHTERSEFLRALHFNYPHITQLYSLGHSWEFRPIWALEISGNPGSPKLNLPKIRYVAGVHGNAASGPELLLELASVLCINYGGNPVITKLINRSRIVIVPCVNPDGRELAEKGMCSSSAGLTNAHGVDLDSDFFFGNMSAQPETRALMDLIAGGGFSLSVTLDGGSLLAAFPYDRPSEPAQNEETFRYLASVYVSNNPVMYLKSSRCNNEPGNIPGGTLRGAQFNSHVGSMKDFSADVGLCPEITVYTGCCLYPSVEQLHFLWVQHRMALFAMLLEIHKGVSGVVRDRERQPVVNAVIMVNGSVLVRTNAQGFFHTLLAPGTQQLQVQAQGFQEQLREVNVSSHQRSNPIEIEFSEHVTHGSTVAVLAAAIAIVAVMLCFLLVWHIRSVKFSRIRNLIGWPWCEEEDLRMEVIMSEKSPLRGTFLEECESEEDAFYIDHY